MLYARKLLLRILDHLNRLPGTDAKAGRQLLLMGIPKASSFTRHEGHRAADFAYIVNQTADLDEIREEEGKLALVIMLDNAIHLFAQGAELGNLLTADINDVMVAYQSARRVEHYERADINNVMVAYEPARRVEHHERGQLYTLDLDETCRDIHKKLVAQASGLIGFAVPCGSPQLVDNLARRLERVWPIGREVFRHPIRKPNPSFTDVHTEIQKSILENLDPHSKGDIMFPIRIVNENFLHLFWNNLSHRVPRERPEAVASYRIVFLLAVDPTSSAPAEMVRLMEPIIELYHVQAFLINTFDDYPDKSHAKSWKDAVLNPLLNLVVTMFDYNEKNKFEPEKIYPFLKYCVSLLLQFPDPSPHEYLRPHEYLSSLREFT